MVTPQSHHETCIAHSGLVSRLNLALVLLVAGVGLQAYAVNINTETRIEMAEFNARMEMRVARVERRLDILENKPGVINYANCAESEQ